MMTGAGRGLDVAVGVPPGVGLTSGEALSDGVGEGVSGVGETATGDDGGGVGVGPGRHDTRDSDAIATAATRRAARVAPNVLVRRSGLTKLPNAGPSPSVQAPSKYRR